MVSSLSLSLSPMPEVAFPRVSRSDSLVPIFSSVVPALPPRRQQPNRFQFLIRLVEERNALLALPFLQMLREAVDVGVQELFARHQIGRAFENDSDFFRQFPFWFLLAAHLVVSGLIGDLLPGSLFSHVFRKIRARTALKVKKKPSKNHTHCRLPHSLANSAQARPKTGPEMVNQISPRYRTGWPVNMARG
jgi:hypothetical protein